MGGRKGEGKKKKKKRKEVLKIGRMANGAQDGCCVSSLDSNREMLEEVGVALHFSRDLPETVAQLLQKHPGPRTDGTRGLDGHWLKGVARK